MRYKEWREREREECIYRGFCADRRNKTKSDYRSGRCENNVLMRNCPTEGCFPGLEKKEGSRQLSRQRKKEKETTKQRRRKGSEEVVEVVACGCVGPYRTKVEAKVKERKRERREREREEGAKG